MFDPYCPTCASRVLVGLRRLRSLENTPAGIVLRFTCRCGGEAVLVTGAGAPPAVVAPATAVTAREPVARTRTVVPSRPAAR